MKPLARQLYRFLSACGGNWRNTIFVSCPESESGSGFLMAADRDGCIDPAECCGQMTKDTFGSVFAQYLLWHTNQS